MKKINTLFTESSHEAIDSIESVSMNSKSEIARAALNFGLSYLSAGKINMTDKEFYSFVNDCQDIDNQMLPKQIEKKGVSHE